MSVSVPLCCFCPSLCVCLCPTLCFCPSLLCFCPSLLCFCPSLLCFCPALCVCLCPALLCVCPSVSVPLYVSASVPLCYVSVHLFLSLFMCLSLSCFVTSVRLFLSNFVKSVYVPLCYESVCLHFCPSLLCLSHCLPAPFPHPFYMVAFVCSFNSFEILSQSLSLFLCVHLFLRQIQMRTCLTFASF